MHLSHFALTLTAPGLPESGHPFTLPADVVPDALQRQPHNMRDALHHVSTLALDTIAVRVRPVWSNDKSTLPSEASAKDGRDRQKRPRQRLLKAIADYHATCTDPALAQQLLTLKQTLTQ